MRVIREYIKNDQEDVLDVWYSASLIGHPFLDQEFLVKERETIKNKHLPNADTWVYVDGDKVIGFIAMLDNEIGGIFVRSDQQRNGIGRQLLDYVKQFHDTLELTVFANNNVGRLFYEKYGFHKVGEEIDANTGQIQYRLRYEC